MSYSIIGPADQTSYSLSMCSFFKGTSGHQVNYWPPRARPHTTVLSPLAKLRKSFSKFGIGAYIVLTQDAHDSEYVAEADTRRAFISGFTGSAGTAIIGTDFAELSTDGRYYLQAEEQLGPEWTLRKEGIDESWIDALAKKASSENFSIGVDPTLVSYSLVQLLESKLHGGPKLVPIADNLVDNVWPNKPAEPRSKVFELGTEITGETVTSKIQRLRSELEKRNVTAIVISALDEVAWLFNLRGSDIPFNPVFKSYAIVTSTSAYLYVDEQKVQNVHLPHVTIKPYTAVLEDVRLTETIWIPEGGSWALVEAAKTPLVGQMSPVARFKATKTKEEIQGARDAQLKCGLSFVRLFNWLEHNIDHQEITEYDAAQKLLAIRQKLPDFMGLSYESISSVGANAAIIHYAPPPDSKFVISRQEPYLLDAGCQFLHGTTDTTRTVHFGTPSHEVMRAYTLVLKGHIALSMAVFPAGTTGGTLDVLARQHLWQFGLNYRHGTGHGVGSFLNVHEKPVGFGRAGYDDFPYSEGVITSNEPGCYFDHKFGVRVESMLVAQRAKTPYQYDDVQYYEFEYITVVPLALNMIDKSLLTVDEIKWINAYGKYVHKVLAPHLNEQEKVWLVKNTHPI